MSDDLKSKKPRLSYREQQLARLQHADEYLHLFLMRNSSPTLRWPKVEEAQEEIQRELRMRKLELEDEDIPGIRRQPKRR